MIRLDRKSEPSLAQEPPTLFKSYEQMWPAEFFNTIDPKRPFQADEVEAALADVDAPLRHLICRFAGHGSCSFYPLHPRSKGCGSEQSFCIPQRGNPGVRVNIGRQPTNLLLEGRWHVMEPSGETFDAHYQRSYDLSTTARFLPKPGVRNG